MYFCIVRTISNVIGSEVNRNYHREMYLFCINIMGTAQ